MKEIKTIKDTNEVYRAFGLQKPENPLDDNLFPNGEVLINIYNIIYNDDIKMDAVNKIKLLKEIVKEY